MTRFIIKLVLNGIVVIPGLLWFTEASVGSSVITAFLLVLIAYLIGDQFILRATNNVIATVADAILAAIYLWMVAYFKRWSLSIGELLLTVAALGVVEFFFHRYLGYVDPRETEKS